QNAFPGVGLDELWKHPDAAATWPNPISELEKNDIVIDSDRQARNVEPTAMDGNMKSLITSHWHLIVHQTLGAQLYDWIDDPGELRNLSHTAPGAAVVKSLISEIRTSTSPYKAQDIAVSNTPARSTPPEVNLEIWPSARFHFRVRDSSAAKSV